MKDCYTPSPPEVPEFDSIADEVEYFTEGLSREDKSVVFRSVWGSNLEKAHLTQDMDRYWRIRSEGNPYSETKQLSLYKRTIGRIVHG